MPSTSVDPINTDRAEESKDGTEDPQLAISTGDWDCLEQDPEHGIKVLAEKHGITRVALVNHLATDAGLTSLQGRMGSSRWKWVRVKKHIPDILVIIGLLILTFLALRAIGVFRIPWPAATVGPSVGLTPAGRNTARYFESIRSQPLSLLAFLREMPKGGDLHSHLSGAIYAETYIKWACQRRLCIDQQTMALGEPPCGVGQTTLDDGWVNDPAQKPTVPFNRMIDAWSMRNMQLSGQSGHDQFFGTFKKFSPAGTYHEAEMLVEVTSRAAAEHVAYLELSLTPTVDEFARLLRSLTWDDDLGKMRDKLATSAFRNAVACGSAKLSEMEARRRSQQRCGASESEPGCDVEVRYIFQVKRSDPPAQVFAQMLAGFEMAGLDDRVVGLNLVQPEDDAVALRDFSLHMRMLDYLHNLYPGVHITLHAGELAAGLVPPEALRSHIRESIEQGHAERIGHGVDLAFEDDPSGLLKEMAKARTLVEICLTSNDAILGVRGRQHPLKLYMDSGVPVALATDDMGVSRSDITHEYLKSVEEHGLNYTQLKKMARASLEYAFIAGSSLWSDPETLKLVPQCSTADPTGGTLPDDCRQFLDSSRKARVQWGLERAFKEFEARNRTL